VTRAVPRTVLHAASFAPEHPGNFVAALEALDRAGAARGFRQAFAFPAAAAARPWLADLRAAGRDVTTLPPGAGPLAATRALARLARDRDAVLLHAHFGAYDLPAWLAARLFRGGGRPPEVLWHLHSDLERGGGAARRAREALRWRLLSRRVHLVAVSPHVREQAAARGVDPARVRVLPNGVDTGRARISDAEPSAARAAAGIGPDRTVLLVFGWDPERKGADLALEAMEALAPGAPGLVLALVGGPALEAFVGARYGGTPPPWLRVLPPHAHPADYYRMADLFLSASRREGMPYSVAEAMANGRPVLASRIPGHRPALEAPGAVGFGPGDAGALEGAIREALGWSPEERARRGEANRAFADARLGIGAWTEGMLAIYEGILG